MVAIAGPGWRLAPSLVWFVTECDQLDPDRPRANDGSIGDAAHSARVSDHNPDDDETDRDLTRWVCAVDITDGSRVFDIDQVLDDLRRRRDPRVKYAISDGRIWKSYVSTAGPAYTWLRYTGVNDHTKHGHVSIHNTAAARHDVRSWFTKEAPAMTLTEQDLRLIRAEVEGGVLAVLAHPTFNVDEAEEQHAGLGGSLASVRRLARAALTAQLTARGMAPDDAAKEVARIEGTPNAVLGP